MRKGARFSPHGQFVTYSSDESAGFEIHVCPVPGHGKLLVSLLPGVGRTRHKVQPLEIDLPGLPRTGTPKLPKGLQLWGGGASGAVAYAAGNSAFTRSRKAFMYPMVKEWFTSW